MATETHIPESVYLKIGEKEDNALSCEILEEKVTELVGNKVKHVESSRQVAETVNTQVEAGIPTNESGTFFQALSVPMASSNPESFHPATTKDQDPKFVKTSESVEEITPSVEIENEGLHDGITTDVCDLTKTNSEAETIENEEKNDEKAIEKEACEETGTEKDQSAVGLKFSYSMAPCKQEGDRDGVTSTPDETCEDKKETTATVAGIKEQDLNEMPREFVKQETGDKSIDTQEAIEQWESVKKIEQEEETEEIRPSVEKEEKMDSITTNACISTQTKSQVENTEHEEMDKEEATRSDDGQKEKSGIPSVKDVCVDNSSEKVEYESSEIKLNDEEREQEVNVLEKDQDEDVVTSAQDVSSEGNEREVVTGKKSIEEDTEETKSSVETTDVCISTQTKPEEKTTKNEEKNDEETIESDDGQTKKSGSHMVKEICEETVSEMTESEEGLKPSDSSSMVLTGNEIARKDEDQEMEQELYVSEKDQTESLVKTTKLEGGHAEVTESDDGQKENSESILIKEVCEETNYEKVESERVELSDSSSIKQNEKAITTLSKDEVQEKEQDQDEDDVTLHDGTNADVCVSTQAELEKETIENEDKNDAKPIEKEVCEETSPEKAESEVVYQLSDSMVPSKKEDLNTVEKDKCDSDGVTSSQDTTCEDIKETTPDQFAATVADFKEQDLNEFLKEEIEDKSTDAQQASEECQNGENDKTEQTPEESVKHEDQENEKEVNILEKDQVKDDFTSTQDVSVEGGLLEKTYHVEDIEHEIVKERESIEEDTLEIKSSVETPEKTEQHRLINAVSTDVCISTQTEPNETTETQEKNDEEAIENDDGQTKKPGIPMVEEICEETVLEKHEKAESEEELKLSNSTSMVLNENEIMSKDEYQVQELYLSEKDQSGRNDVTISQNESNEDIKETTIGHVTTVADLEEEAEDKAIDAQEASERYEDRANDNKEQKSEDSVKDIVLSFSKIEPEEYTEEIKPSVETNEEKNVCISTQTESQEEATKNEEKAIEDDDDLKEKSENPFVKEVREETDLKKTESEEDKKLSDSSKMNLNEKAVEIISKDEDQEKEQKLAVFEDELQGNNNDGECNELKNFQIRESIKGNNEDIRASVETEEIMEHQGSLHDITSDVSLLTQKESQEDTTKNEEKNEEPIKSDDGRKEKHDITPVEEVCEETSLEKVESEEGLELYDSLNMKINEKTITFKDEDHEKDQEVNTPEEVQDKDNVTGSHDAISKEEEELQQKNYHNESNEPEFFKTRENADEEIKSSVEKKENSEQQWFSHVTTNDVCSSTQAKEEKIKNEARLDAENQADSTEDKSEMEDEAVSTEKMSSEEQKGEEIEACLTKTTEDEVTKKDQDSSHISIQDTNDGTTKEEKCFLYESRDIEISTLEHEPTEEQNSGLDEVSKENITDLNETTVVEPQDTPSSSLESSTKDTSNSEKAKAESEILPIEDLESVTEIQIPDVVPNSEDSKLISVRGMHLDEEKEIVTEENSSDEKTEQPTKIKKETFEEVIEKCESDKLEDQEKEQEVHMLEKDQGEDEITSAQDVAFEGGVEERNHHSEGNEHEEVKTKERIVEDVEEIRSSVEGPDRAEQQRLINVIPTDVCISTQTELEEKTTENEEKNDEKAICQEIISEKVETEEGGEDDFQSSKNASNEDINESTHDQYATTVANFEEEKGESVMTEEIIREKAVDNSIDAQEMSSELGQPKEQNLKIGAFLTTTTNEKSEDEITKKDEDSSHDSMDDTNDSTVKEEKCTLEPEPVDEQNGRRFDEVSKENLVDLYDTTAVKHQEDVTPSGTLGTLTEDTSNSEKAKAESEVLPIGDLESVSEIQIPEVVPNSEDSNLIEGCLISVTETHVDEEKETERKENSSDEKTEQTTEIKQETFEKTSSEKAGSEGFKISDSSNMEIKVMTTFNDEDQEKGQEVNISAEGQGMDNVTSAQDANFEEDLQEKNYQNKDNEHKFNETRESIDEDTKEIISSVETKELKSESPFFTEVCEATSSEKAEPEDGVKHSESLNMKVVEDEVVSKEENLEKKQELTMSEVQGGRDDVIISDNVSNEDIQETTTGQRATAVVNFEEGQDLSATTKEILVEEAAEDKSVDAQEASEPCENEGKDKSEQNPEESVDRPVKSCVEDKSEVKDEFVSTEKMPSEHEQPKEQNIEEIEACLTETVNEKPEDEITKKVEDSSHESIEGPNDNTTRQEKRSLEYEPAEEQHGGLDEVSKENLTNLYETTAVEPQEDITPSSSLGTSTEDASAKAESENLPIEDLESVSQVQIPEVVPKSADVKAKEKCLMAEAATKEINPEAYGERELTFESTDDDHINETIQQADKSYITSEENVTQLEQIGDNDSPYEKRDMEEDCTQENQLNSTKECGEMVKDAILTEKISYSDPIPVTNHEVTQVRVDTQIGQEDLQATEDISRESKVKNDSVDEAPKKEIILSLEEVKTIEPEVNLSNIESTAYPSESEKLPTPALEYVGDVQAREISADSEDREVKEECIVLATAEYTDENRVEEEEKNNTNEILSVLAEENVMQVPEEKSDLNREEKASTEESLEQHGELKPASESIIEEDKVNKIEAQPEKSDIASENIMNDQEFKLEHMTEKDLEDGKSDMEEDLTLAPENQIESIENHNDIMKNVILTDEDDKRLTELDKTSTSTSNQKELANEIELSKPILVENTKVTELKAESQIELENIQPAEVKDDSVDEPLKDEIIQVLEDDKALELQVNLPEIESIDTPSNEQDSMPCSTQETVEEKGVRVSQLTDREILVAPDVEFEKKEKDVQTPEAILSEEHPEATNDTCETLIGVESSEKKLISMVPPEENTSPIVEDQANELVPETDKTEVEHSSISNTDQNPKFMEEGFTETFSENQTSIKERYIEVERKCNFAVANKEEKSGIEVVEDVIVSEVLLEDETAKESKSIKDNINEEAIHNQLTSATDQVCENERSNSSPDEVVEKKDLVGDTEDPKLMAENLNLKDESFTVMKASKEDSDLVAPEFESLEKMATEEKIIETDAYEEKETLEVRSEDSRGHGDMIKLGEKANEVSEVAEIVPEGRREATAVLSENLQEDFPKMILAKHDPEIITATEKIEDKKTGELQVSTLNYETDEGKQNAPGDMQNKEREIVQPQESSEDNTLLSQNDNKIDYSLVLPSVENNTKQVVDTRFEDVPVVDVLKHEKGLDHTTEVKSVDVASNAECSEIEPPHIDTKEATSELINQENQKESDDNIEALIPIEDVKSSTKVKSADLEVLSVMDPNNKKDEAYEAEKGVLNGDEHLESTGDRSKPTEELSGMKQELDTPVTLGIGATDDLKISQKNLTDDLTKISETQPEIQKYEASAACIVDKQSPNEKTAKSLIAEVQDLNAIKASNTLPQCSSEDFKEEEKMSDQKDMSPEPTKVNPEVADQNIIGEREVALTKDEKVDKEEIGEENEEEEDNEKTGDTPVMVEASKDMEVKVHKKSHNILSGVGSKVKHSIAKVKKAITGKSSHQKPPSP